MEAEPTLPAAPKPKRRWYQFSLRTLLVVVTLICVVVGGYVHWQAEIVRERKQMRSRIVELGGSIATDSDREPLSRVPWLRRVLGDEPVAEINMEFGTPDSELLKIREAFPEAEVVFVWR